MAWRSASSFVSRDLDPRLSDAVITHSSCKPQEASRTLRRRLNRTFVARTLR